MTEVWLVTIPNKGKTTIETIRRVTEQITPGGLCEQYTVEMPNFSVGTLDTLMALSDEIPKLNTLIENTIRKIERQYSDVGGRTQDPLRVQDSSPMRFLHTFQWDFARFPRRPLPEMIQNIKTTVGRVDDELRSLSQAYLDRVQFLSALKRKKSANFATSDLEDFLPPTILQEYEFLDTEYLVTVLVIVPKHLEQDFLIDYADIGSNIAVYGGPDWRSHMNEIGVTDQNCGPEFKRDKVKGSPVVPGSARPILSTNDQVVFAVTILKGHYVSGYYDREDFVPGQYVNYIDAFKEACKERRFTARDFVFDAEKAGALDKQIESCTWDLENLVNTLMRWCRAHYGESFSAWIHLKIIHAFIESVLRYGLPVDFAALFIEPNERKVDQAERALKRCIASFGDIFHGPSMTADDDDDEENEGGEVSDNLPFVLQKFTPVRA